MEAQQLLPQQEQIKHPVMVPQGCCLSHSFGVTLLLDQCPPELTHTGLQWGQPGL